MQQDHIDWGYHLTALYGTDYRYTTGKGYWNTPAAQRSPPIRIRSHPRIHRHLYSIQVAQGLNLRLGRFISVPGIEAQLTPNNYVFSHSLLYAIDPFTDTGLMATVKLNDQWLVQLGITAGHDVAPWTPDAKPSGTACLSYTTKSVNDNIYLCANGINDAKYAYNNLQQYDATWYHKFSKTVHMATETWFMYQRDVPALAGRSPRTRHQPRVLSAGRTALHRSRIRRRQFSPERIIGPRLSLLSQRLSRRQKRTAHRLRHTYSENTITWCHWFGTTVQLRPELRFERAWDQKAFDNGRTA